MKQRGVKGVLSILLAFATTISSLVVSPVTALAATGIRTSQTISANYAIKTDNTLWDFVKNQKVMDNVKSVNGTYVIKIPRMSM